MARTKPTYIMLVTACIGVVVGTLAREPILALFREKESPPAQPTLKLPPTADEVARPNLTWADDECKRVIDKHIAAIDTFFADAKRNTPAFAEDALSYGSKWRLIGDHARTIPYYYLKYGKYVSVEVLVVDLVRPDLIEKLPKEPGDSHQQFIREKFEERVFKADQLQAAVAQAVDSYLKHVKSIESQMLVKMREDVADFPATYVIGRLDDQKLQQSYDEAVSRAITATKKDLGANIGTEIASQITGQVLAHVAVRLLVSSGILAAGAESAPATFGIGLAVAIIVDDIVSRVWNWYADPKGSLAAEVDKKLDEIRRLILDGTNDAKGLRVQLQDIANERARVRSEAVLTILNSKGP